jgi:hypothetical protein
MADLLQRIFSDLADKFLPYLPNLFAGVMLMVIGLLLGWVVKRIVIQVLAVLRIDRLFRKFKWGFVFSKADVRYTFLVYMGNIAFAVVFFILFIKALEVLQLPLLSNIIQTGMLFIPRLLTAAAFFGLGWLFAGWIAFVIHRTLAREDIPRSALIAKSVKAIIVLFFAAMGLGSLDIAREIVVIGFTVTMITIGLLAIAVTILGGKNLVSKLFGSSDE